MRPQLTKAQGEALKWFAEHTGDGCFDNDGVLLAGGELAPFMRSTWNALRDVGLIEFYNPAGKGRGRARLTRGPGLPPLPQSPQETANDAG